MNALIATGFLCICAVQFAQGATFFTTLPNSESVFSRVEITDDAARVLISTSADFIGADIAVESLLGDPASLLVFQVTAVPLATLPSPPFSLGGIDYPASPSRLVFEQEYALTETQVAQFADLSSVTLLFSGGSLPEPVSLTLSAIPEPSGLSMFALAAVTTLCNRRRRGIGNKTGEQVGAQEAPKALRVL